MERKALGKILRDAVPAAFVAGMIVLLAFRWDFYYDLNDDVLIKDILSGIYTGVPAAHNIQMLYPVSLLLSLLCRFFGGSGVYGIFLCLMQFGALWLILREGSRRIDNKTLRAQFTLFVMFFAFGVLASHLVFIQYTFTVSMMAGAAAVLLILADNIGSGMKIGAWIICLIIWIAFGIRSEMLLLMMPLMGVAFFIRLLLDKGRLRAYIIWAIVLFAGMGLIYGADKLAYSGAEWSEFRELFDARTKLYDYEFIPSYEGNEDFYESIGLDASEVELFHNYDYGLDDEIDADVMRAVADHAQLLKAKRPFKERLAAAVKEYIYRLYSVSPRQSHEYPQTDAPWNILVMVLYLGLIVISSPHIRGLLISLCLFGVRSALWLYILYGERAPVRVVHGLFFMELCILMAVIIREVSNAHSELMVISIRAFSLVTALATLISVIAIRGEAGLIDRDISDRKDMSAAYDELWDYIDSDTDHFYWLDVYTSVAWQGIPYSEKIFGYRDNGISRHDLPGGWAFGSPVQRQKLENLSVKSPMESLTDGTALLVMKKDGSTDWLLSYYNSKGVEVQAHKEALVGDSFVIYKIELRQQ
ncbi:hypothetical protein [Butyrivibrio sp. MC2013]|uniref:hypothetical protein n=1 Tax=Butyrivibrio sp. MC2013 TaxID=1280686 RepID=UPI00040EB125|nr:hypothetical protein [Butyrivibrio sp. MC2013]